MQLHEFLKKYFLWGPLLMGLTVACSILGPTGAEIQPTRTPLPTFTSTSVAAAEANLLPTPAATTPLLEPTTAAPTAQPPPTNTPVPEESSNETEESVETGEVQKEVGGEEATAEEAIPEEPTISEAPPPTEAAVEPPPPAEPAAGAHGVIGKISFRDGRNTYGVGERVFVKIEAMTTQAGQMPFGILGLTTSTGAFQTSWSSGTVDGTFTHEDGIPFSSPGNHKLWLSICFSTEQICQGSDGDWERFEPGLDVVIQ